MSVEPRILHLFEGYGVELEYMIVDAETLDVRPIADRLIVAERGCVANEVERDGFAWSNELASHVIELKTNGPVADLEGLGAGFQREVARVEEHLASLGARLLPTAMHPWMEPTREFSIWPHGDRMIYEAFHRVFDCRGHGWANLQSAHLNLPFANDDEFGRLHAASRALLPLLPALAAASPFLEAKRSGSLDTRLAVYRTNARRVPSVTGQVIPEPLFTRRDYDALLGAIYADLAPVDPEGALQYEWVNARGCIARFDRMAIEIRLLDVQECPSADLAIAYAVVHTLRALCAEELQGELRKIETGFLSHLLCETTAHAGAAKIDDTTYLTALGLDAMTCAARDVWCSLIEKHARSERAAAEFLPALDVILREGCLAERILSRTGPKPERMVLKEVYEELAECLQKGEPFRGTG